MPKAEPRPTATRQVEAKRARLREVGAELEQVEARRAELYGERLELFRWLREECVPPVPNKDIGDDARVGDIAVIATLRKDRLAREQASAGR